MNCPDLDDPIVRNRMADAANELAYDLRDSLPLDYGEAVYLLAVLTVRACEAIGWDPIELVRTVRTRYNESP